jgi:signal transduction histidine kinase
VAKHAGATRVRLAVTRHDERLELAIEDHGGAAPEAPFGSGHGLVGMRERVVALGGSLEAGIRPEGGFRVGIVLPLTQDPD